MSPENEHSSTIEIEYGADSEFAALAQVLGKVSRPGSFYSYGSREIPLPTMNVRGVGRVPFPVPVSVAEAMVRESAEMAPFGRGEETVLDESVRKVWQIPPNLFTLSGHGWKQALDDLIEQVRDDLGCREIRVEAQLYKLLVYGKGGHFAAHRDTEKANGMFGTLVVTLPSAHEGGDLLVRHAGKEVSLDLCPHESAEIRHAAFFADCEHEVVPVTDGYRICLVYNLLRIGKGEPLAPADDRIACREASRILRKWAERVLDEDPPTRKIVYLLTHKYTEASLSFQALKGGDAALAGVLGEAADDSDFDLHLAMVHIGEYGYFDGWYGYGDEPDEGDMHEAVVDDSHAYLSGWRDRADQSVDLGSMNLDPGLELLPPGALDGEPPDEINFHSSTGNEGASFDRAYLRAALVLWPKDNAIPIAMDGGPGVMTSLLRHRAKDTSAINSETLEILADRILESLEGYDLYNLEWVPNFIEVLHSLNFTDTLWSFWQGPLMEYYRGRWNEHLTVSLDCFSPGERVALISPLLQRYACCLPLDCLALWTLTALRFHLETDALSGILAPLVQDLSTAKQGFRDGDSRPFSLFKSRTLSASREHHYEDEEVCEVHSLFTPTLFMEFIGQIQSQPFSEDLRNAMIANPTVFSVENLLYPAWDLSLQHKIVPGARDMLWVLCASALLRRSEYPPPAPENWVDATPIRENSETAKELVRFLRDPDLQHFAYRAAQHFRYEMENLIFRYRLELDTRTEEKGRPYTLHLTKNRATYHKAVKIHREDIQRMRALITPPNRIPPSASHLSERCRLAVEK
jgi:hypothetical protein